VKRRTEVERVRVEGLGDREGPGDREVATATLTGEYERMGETAEWDLRTVACVPRPLGDTFREEGREGRQTSTGERGRETGRETG
jgi:hypothetical protein